MRQQSILLSRLMERFFKLCLMTLLLVGAKGRILLSCGLVRKLSSKRLENYSIVVP